MGMLNTKRFIKYTFPAAGTTDIALAQTTVSINGQNVLPINGTFANSGSVSFIGYARNVSAISLGAASAATITITGTQNGAPVTDTITNLNGATGYTEAVFDTVTSITSSAQITSPNSISIGTGYYGFFVPLSLDPYSAFLNYNLYVGNVDKVTVDDDYYATRIWGTLDKVIGNGRTIIQNIGAEYDGGNLLTIEQWNSNFNLIKDTDTNIDNVAMTINGNNDYSYFLSSSMDHGLKMVNTSNNNLNSIIYQNIFIEVMSGSGPTIPTTTTNQVSSIFYQSS